VRLGGSGRPSPGCVDDRVAVDDDGSDHPHADP
jgi:hypothetical protein